jgi:hypothetical protein
MKALLGTVTLLAGMAVLLAVLALPLDYFGIARFLDTLVWATVLFGVGLIPAITAGIVWIARR